MQTFLERLAQPQPILMDGATGTELNRRGVDTSVPLWSARALLDAQDVLKQIHLDYLQAGAEVLTTNTFRTHRRTLELVGLGDQTLALNQLAVNIARQAINEHMLNGGQQAYVAGSIAPLEDCYRPDKVPGQDFCVREQAEMANILFNAGADFLLIETMNTIREAQAAALAARDISIPFMVSFVCREDGNLFSGESVSDAVEGLISYQPFAIGINCTPSATIHNPLHELLAHSSLPASAYANIGHTDDIQGWENTDDVSPPEYGLLVQSWLNENIRLIGGCCGTTPAHIHAARDAIQAATF